MLGLMHWSVRLADKDINTGYILGLLIIAVQAVISYRTFGELARHGYHKKIFIVWLLLIIQLLSSLFVVLFVMRLFDSGISCYSFAGETLVCKDDILTREGTVIPLPDVNILATINAAAFLLIQIISRMHLAEHEFMPV